MDKVEIQKLIDDRIYTNDNGEITATNVNDTLTEIVEASQFERDETLETEDKTVVGAINELKRGSQPIIDAVGEKTPEGGEIFNNYDFNTALKGAHSEGGLVDITKFIPKEYEEYNNAEGIALYTQMDISEGLYNNSETDPETGELTSKYPSIYTKISDTDPDKWELYIGVITAYWYVKFGKGFRFTIFTSDNIYPIRIDDYQIVSADIISMFTPNGPLKYCRLVIDGSKAVGNIGKYYDYHSAIGSNGTYLLDSLTLSGSTINAITKWPMPTGLDADFNDLDNFGNSASGENSHAEGVKTIAVGEGAHAEGENNTALGDASHVEGDNNIVTVRSSHAEGAFNIVNAPMAHAEGHRNTVKAPYSHAEGLDNRVEGGKSHAEGFKTVAYGGSSHSEGVKTIAAGEGAHAEGGSHNSHSRAVKIETSCKRGRPTPQQYQQDWEDAINMFTYEYIQDDGLQMPMVQKGAVIRVFNMNQCWTVKDSYMEINAGTPKIVVTLHTDPNQPMSELNVPETFNGFYSFEGGNAAAGVASHVEGVENIAAGVASHAEGKNNGALGDASHAGGFLTVAQSPYSFAHGERSIAQGKGSIAFGEGCMTYDDNDIAMGKNSYVGDPTVEGPYDEQVLGLRGINIGVTAEKIPSENPFGKPFNKLTPYEKYMVWDETRYSLNEGMQNNLIGPSNTCIGQHINALGTSNYISRVKGNAIGYDNRVFGNCATAIGNYNRAVGDYSIALGGHNNAGAWFKNGKYIWGTQYITDMPSPEEEANYTKGGIHSFSVGYENIPSPVEGNVMMGRYPTPYCPFVPPFTSLFAIGNGNGTEGEDRTNAFGIYEVWSEDSSKIVKSQLWPKRNRSVMGIQTDNVEIETTDFHVRYPGTDEKEFRVDEEGTYVYGGLNVDGLAEFNGWVPSKPDQAWAAQNAVNVDNLLFVKNIGGYNGDINNMNPGVNDLAAVINKKMEAFDATDLWIAYKAGGTVSDVFKIGLRTAAQDGTPIFIWSQPGPETTVNLKVTYAKFTGFVGDLIANDDNYIYFIKLNKDRTVNIEKRSLYGVNRYPNNETSIFTLEVGSDNSIIQDTLRISNGDVVLPSAGDIFEVHESGTQNLNESGVVISRYDNPTRRTIDYIIESNNLVFGVVRQTNIRFEYDPSVGPDSLKVLDKKDYELDPSKLDWNKISALYADVERMKKEPGSYNISNITGKTYEYWQNAATDIQSHLNGGFAIGMKVTFVQKSHAGKPSPRTMTWLGYGNVTQSSSWKFDDVFVIKEDARTRFILSPNEYLIRNVDADLHIDLDASMEANHFTSGVIDEYMFELTTGATVYNVGITQNMKPIKWAGGMAPVFKPNHTYQFSIMRGIGVFVEAANEVTM